MKIHTTISAIEIPENLGYLGSILVVILPSYLRFFFSFIFAVFKAYEQTVFP